MKIAHINHKLPHYIELTRLNRPIGIYLLMWPMLWAFWFAAEGLPNLDLLIIFILGTVLTRSAGCAINDFADRDFDGHVERTRSRPLATGSLTSQEAIVAAIVLTLIAFLLVLLTNPLTIALSFVAAGLAALYPFTKRFIQLPQVVLGAAFGFAVPMAFAAQTNSVPALAWWLFVAAVLWAVAYDTLYAMADRDDDLSIGVKSSAILFGRYDLMAVGLIQLCVLAILTGVGLYSDRGIVYFLGVIAGLGFVTFQLYIARHREPAQCIRAFLNNHWLGMSIFIALVSDYALQAL